MMQAKLDAMKKMLQENPNLFRGKIGQAELDAIDRAIQISRLEKPVRREVAAHKMLVEAP